MRGWFKEREMKARIDRDLCAGTGTCEEICPAVFRLVDGFSEVKVEMVPPRQEEACREARDACPTGAITVEE